MQSAREERTGHLGRGRHLCAAFGWFSALGWSLLLMSIASASVPTVVAAGANAYATAYLSWAEDHRQEDLTAIPSGRFPLFVKIAGVQQAQQVAMTLEWYPMITDGGCYSLLSAATTDSCGAVLDIHPAAAFLGDDGYTWTMDLGGQRSGELCVRYEFTGDSCGTILPGRLMVTRLAVVDSAGQVDEVFVDNPITILGGTGVPNRLVVQRAGIATLFPGATQGFRIVGWGFDSTASARIELDAGGSLDAAGITLESTTSLFATFAFPDEFEGWGRLIVSDPRGLADTLASRVLVSDTTAATGSGVNGFEWALSKGGEGGDWWKSPGESSWVFQPSVPDSILSSWLAGGAGGVVALNQRLTAFSASMARSVARKSPSRFSIASPNHAVSKAVANYADTLLFAERFEGGGGGFEDPGWEVLAHVGGASSEATWGVVDSLCGRALGAHALHCATIGNCRSYPTNQGAQLKSRRVSVYTPNTSRVIVDCQTWVDTDSIIDSATGDNLSDRLFAFISTNDGQSWQVLKPGFGYSGRERRWLARRILDRAVTEADPTYLEVRVKFVFASAANHELDREGAYLDEIVVKGAPFPNLTFMARTPPVVISPTIGERNYSSVVPARTNYFNFWAVNNSTTAPQGNGQFKVELRDAAVSTLARMDPREPGLLYVPNDYGRFDEPFAVPQVCGDWYDLTAVLDADNEIHEMNESVDDNTYRLRVPVLQGHPAEVAVDGPVWSTWAGSTLPCTGEPVTLHLPLRNPGTEWTASGNEVGLYEGLHRAPTPSDTPLSTAPLPVLPPNGRDTVTFVINSQVAASKSFYFLADCRNDLAEGCYEGNNATGPLGVTWQAPGADLAATSLSAGDISPALIGSVEHASTATPTVDATAKLGSSVPVSIRVRNVGQAPTPKIWTFSWYRDLDHEPTAADVPTRTITVRAALAPFADTTIAFSVTSAVATTWRMHAYANWQGSVPECGRVANNAIGPSTLRWISDSLVVRGTFTYRDTGYVRTGTRVALGAVHPLRGARVEVWDENGPNADRLLGTTCTGESGEFALALGSHYDPEGSGVAATHLIDVYARAVLEADSVCAGIPAVTVTSSSANPASDTTWTFATSVHWDVADSVLDFGEISPPLGDASYGHRSAMHIYDTILHGAQKMQGYGFSLIEWAPFSWRVFAKWQPGSEPYPAYNTTIYREDTLWVVGQKHARGVNSLTPDEWDAVVLLHEYAHHLARLGLFAYHPPSSVGCGDHDWSRPMECPPGTPAPGYAWEEGWADFAAAMLGLSGPDTTILDRGFDNLDSMLVQRMNIETGWVGLGFASASTPRDHDDVGSSGPSYEAANAGALWDWVDAADDDADPTLCSDHLTEGFDRILTVLRENVALNLDSLANVYAAFQHSEYGGDLLTARALFEVLCDHGWWRPDSVFAADVLPGPIALPQFCVTPSPAQGPVVFTFMGAPTAESPIVEVFDVAGRSLWRATAIGLGEGRWRVTWDAHVRPGVYFARCRASSAEVRRTLVVAR